MGNNTDSAMSSIEDIEYDILIIGPVSLDCNVDYLGNERRELGGAIVQSGYAAVNSGNKVAIYTKFNQSEVDKNNLFKDAKDIRLIIGDSKHTCSIKNIYNTEYSVRQLKKINNIIRAKYRKYLIISIYYMD